MKSKHLHLFLIFLFIVFNCEIKAQYVIEQMEYEIPFSYSLIPEDVEFESDEDEINFILNIPFANLKAAALADGLEIIEEKMLMYLDGDHFAVESETEDMGKVTMVSDVSTGVIHLIMWSEKKTIEMKSEDMKKMEKQANEAIEAAIKDMPPEMQEQVRAEMNTDKDRPMISFEPFPTGKSADINGYTCYEYRIEREEEMISAWVTNDEYGLMDEVKRLSSKIDEMFSQNEENDFDEWQMVPGKIPIQVISYIYDMIMGDPLINIQTITKIEKQKPPADIFKVPGEDEGFTQATVMETMDQITPEQE